MKSVSSIILVLCVVLIPSLGSGGPFAFAGPTEASISPPVSDEVIQVAALKGAGDPLQLGEPEDAATSPLEPLVFRYPAEISSPVSRSDQFAQVFAAPSSESAPEEESVEEIPDPLEPVNRAFFKFNDKLYFWVLKPVASGYKAVLPEDARIGVRNFYWNLTTPVRLVNCLLQADFKGAGTEAIRLVINSTFGLAGFLDTAKKEFHIEKKDRDFGQTLGVYGMGPAFYINWPILGPSSLRETIGYVGDLALDPRTYVFSEPWVWLTWVARPVEVVNDTSLRIGEYEELKRAALDPYVALRDAFFQYRQNKIRNRR
jgi:phospholipid-binding lipoprotein MlaA